MSRAPVLLVMAGGTGGHIMPGLAVAAVLRSQGWQVYWLGDPDKMEGRLVPPQGIELLPLRFSGLRGKGVGAMLKLPFLLLSALCRAWRIFSQVRPDVVLGMGGYVTFPGGVIAAMRRVPLVLHEQNAVAGMSNKALARMARTVLQGFPGALRGAEAVGNPVRAAIAALPAPRERAAGREGPLRLLVVGGSLGAAALNHLIPQALALMVPAQRPKVVHQAGNAHIDNLRAGYAAAGIDAECVAFIDDMAAAMGQADLIICRAGAMTVAEVAAAGVAALFVPFPHAVDDHQTRNAQYLSDHGAAWLQQQASLSAPGMANWLAERNRAELLEVGEKARTYALPDAAAQIAARCERAARRQES